MTTHDPYGALRVPVFRWTFMLHVLTILGSQIQVTATGWYLYNQTQSAAVLGLSGLMMFLPVLLLSIPIGFLVDTRFRRDVMKWGIGLMALSAIAMAAISAQGSNLLWIFIAIAINGLGNACLSISRPTIMREVVAETHAENVANWSSFGRRVASVIGPILAGVLIAMMNGAVVVFVFTAVLYGLSLSCMLRIHVPERKLRTGKFSFKSLTEGIRYIGNSPLILSATLLDMCAVLLGGAMGLLPLYAEDILHVGASGLGLLRAAPSLGSALMAFILAHRKPLQHSGIALLSAVAIYGVLTILFGISTWPIASFIILFFLGVADAVSVTVRATILQVFVPHHLRGRVYGVNMIFIYSSNELGDFESGMLAAAIGAKESVVVGGLGAIAIAVLFGWKWKELRQLKRMQMLPETV